MADATPRGGETVVAHPAWVHALIWVGFPLLGAGAAWLLKSIADWVASLSWAPFQGPFRLVADIPEPQATIGALAVGVVAGLALALLAAMDDVAVTVADDRVVIRRGGSNREIARASIGALFRDGKHLVMTGSATEELARESTDLPAGQLGEAFLAHGYPWLADGDPHRDSYRLWVPDTPDLPGGANALFAARARAVDKHNKDDVAALRSELAKSGIVVRDEKKRQYWRATGQSP